MRSPPRRCRRPPNPSRRRGEEWARGLFQSTDDWVRRPPETSTKTLREFGITRIRSFFLSGIRRSISIRVILRDRASRTARVVLERRGRSSWWLWSRCEIIAALRGRVRLGRSRSWELLSLLSAALFMNWTVVGKVTIDGMQGSYILPVLPLLAWAIPEFSRVLNAY